MKNNIFLLALIISANIFSAPPIENPELSNIVAQAESAFADKQYILAAESYLNAINLTNSDAKAELDEIKPPYSYPYSLALHVHRLFNLQKARQRRTDAFGNECREILAKYKKQAAGEKWEGYMAVYEQLMRHYRVNNNREMVIKTYEEAVNYNLLHNNTSYYIYYLLHFTPQPIDKKTISKIRNLINIYKNAAGKLPSGMALRKLTLTKKTGGDIFPEAINYLKTYPNTIFTELRIAIIMARDAISFDKPEQAKEYYNTLTILAIKQPNTKDSLEIIGFIINEKKKIEAIVPEIKTKI